MIYICYNILLWLSLPFIAFYHLYRSMSRGRRPAFAERFGFVPSERFKSLAGAEVIWIHAVSVGETIAVTPLLKALKQQFPEKKIVLSNVTETGRGIAAKLAEIDLLLYFPFDFRFAARRLLDQVKPTIFMVVETEIWPNFVQVAHQFRIPVVMVNGRISDHSFGRYLKLKAFFRPVLQNFTRFCMQTDQDACRIIEIGAPADRVRVARNLKYDIPFVPLKNEEREQLRSLYKIPSDLLVLTAGSTHAGEEDILAAIYKALQAGGKDIFMILAPRHPERAAAVAEMLKKQGLRFSVRSELPEMREYFRAGEMLLVDTVGELTRLYAFSDMVFVGGSLVPTGGHNVLEPASFGVPVIFVPHMWNFREIAALVLKCSAGAQVGDRDELELMLKELMADRQRRESMGAKGGGLLLENGGSTARHMEVIRQVMGPRIGEQGSVDEG